MLYPLAFTIAFGTMLTLLFTKETADVTVLRGLGAPFREEADGSVANQVRIKVANRGSENARYEIRFDGLTDGRVIAPENPLTVEAGEMRETSVFVLLPRDGFTNGAREVTVTVTDGDRFTTTVPWRLQGPVGAAPATTPGDTP